MGKITGRRLGMTQQAYCFKCKIKVDVQEAKEVTMSKTGMRRLSGKCGRCGSGLSLVLKK